MLPRYQIKRITVKSETRELHIVWGDGHESRYPFGGLRRVCPCVSCQGGHDKMGQPVDSVVFLEPAKSKAVIREIVPVGNYGIQLKWDDGHQAGIYRFEYLRDICPVEKGLI
ncbi:DUF971 domain-containing protein [Balneolaceae bacterium ANBcel3]|nr:DUF971 domain-containing protein [Balneolaceae bacterium ANBcel3]